MLASKLACLVLQTSDDAGMRTTQSLFGYIWQVSTWPDSNSAWLMASSMYSPILKLPDSQEDLQAPQAPSRQSMGTFIFWR